MSGSATFLIKHCGERIDVDRHSQVWWRFVRSHDKPRLMGVASHLLCRWYRYFYDIFYLLLMVEDIRWFHQLIGFGIVEFSQGINIVALPGTYLSSIFGLKNHPKQGPFQSKQGAPFGFQIWIAIAK